MHRESMTLSVVCTWHRRQADNIRGASPVHGRMKTCRGRALLSGDSRVQTEHLHLAAVACQQPLRWRVESCKSIAISARRRITGTRDDDRRVKICGFFYLPIDVICVEVITSHMNLQRARQLLCFAGHRRSALSGSGLTISGTRRGQCVRCADESRRSARCRGHNHRPSSPPPARRGRGTLRAPADRG